MSTICVVTDSTSDIPAEVAERLNIQIVPCYINFGTESYLDQEELTRSEFYVRLESDPVHPTTAAAPSGLFGEAYQRLVHAASGIVSIHPPDHYSALRQSALNGWELVKETASIPFRALDGGQLSMGLGWIVIKAARAAAGGADMDAIEHLVTDLRKRVHLFAALDTIKYVHRSGRVGWARGAIGRLLRVRPMLKIYQGEVLSLGYVRTRSQAMDRLLSYLYELGDLDCLTLLHSNAPGLADSFQQKLPPMDLSEQILTINATPVLGTHVGPNGVGFVAVQH